MYLQFSLKVTTLSYIQVIHSRELCCKATGRRIKGQYTVLRGFEGSGKFVNEGCLAQTRLR